jgi:thiol-disulfide isomerase/thioredoxin
MMKSKSEQRSLWMNLIPGSTLVVLLLGGGAILGLGAAAKTVDLSNLIAVNAPAPELVGDGWLNTPGDAPITLASRRGKITIVHFWTFGCINCRHNLPSYARWQQQFADANVVVIGVHTPEFESERITANVARRVKELGITYPVLLDPHNANWNRWQQQYWPTVYLIDKRGRIRYRWVGELEYNHAGGEAKIAELVSELLKEKP